MILFAWPPQTSKETTNLKCYYLWPSQFFGKLLGLRSWPACLHLLLSQSTAKLASPILLQALFNYLHVHIVSLSFHILLESTEVLFDTLFRFWETAKSLSLNRNQFTIQVYIYRWPIPPSFTPQVNESHWRALKVILVQINLPSDCRQLYSVLCHILFVTNLGGIRGVEEWGYQVSCTMYKELEMWQFLHIVSSLHKGGTGCTCTYMYTVHVECTTEYFKATINLSSTGFIFLCASTA